MSTSTESLSTSTPARTVKSWAAQSAASALAPFSIGRREPLPQDVAIDILYCGVCHSDLHQVRNEWHNSVYPVVPGHEIVGRVVKTGRDVTKFKAGDLAAVGCMVDSCRVCASCRRGLEQYCEKFPVLTYNGADKVLGGPTFGGYSESIVVDEAFTLKISDKLDLAATAPLLCAGITTYSPLRHWKVGPGQKVGIVGLGGLGHMGVKFARAFGAHVVLFTTSPSKTADGLRLGAHEVVVSKDADQMKKQAGTLRLRARRGLGRSRHQCVSAAVETGRDADPGGCAGSAAAGQRVRPDYAAPEFRGIGHRRHRGNPGDAGLLRRTRNRQRYRNHRHPAGQRGLRAVAEGRCEIPVRYRHGVFEAIAIRRAAARTR